MTAPVDVLAVMDAYPDLLDFAACHYEAHFKGPGNGGYVPSPHVVAGLAKAAEARAAVAELLEADTEYELLCSVFPCPEDRVAELIGDLAEYAAKIKAADQRRHVALLRCKGGAA